MELTSLLLCFGCLGRGHDEVVAIIDRNLFCFIPVAVGGIFHKTGNSTSKRHESTDLSQIAMLLHKPQAGSHSRRHQVVTSGHLASGISARLCFFLRMHTYLVHPCCAGGNLLNLALLVSQTVPDARHQKRRGTKMLNNNNANINTTVITIGGGGEGRPWTTNGRVDRPQITVQVSASKSGRIPGLTCQRSSPLLS